MYNTASSSTSCDVLITPPVTADPEEPTEYYKYWPQEEGLYDDILVRMVSETSYSGFKVRHFRIGPVEVRHIHRLILVAIRSQKVVNHKTG